MRADLRNRHAQRHEKGDDRFGVKMEDGLEQENSPVSPGMHVQLQPSSATAISGIPSISAGIPSNHNNNIAAVPMHSQYSQLPGQIPTTTMASVSNPSNPPGLAHLAAYAPLPVSAPTSAPAMGLAALSGVGNSIPNMTPVHTPSSMPQGLSPGPGGGQQLSSSGYVLPLGPNNQPMPQKLSHLQQGGVGPDSEQLQGGLPGMIESSQINPSTLAMENTLPPLNNSTLLVNALDVDMRSKLHSRALPKPWQPDEVPPVSNNPLTPRPMFSFDAMTDYDLNAESSQLLSWLFGDASSLSEQFDSPTSQATFSPPSPAPEDLSISDLKQQELLAVIPQLADDVSSVSKLTYYLHKYWDVMNVQIALLHRPSFRVGECPPGLLWSMILMGAGLAGNQVFANRIAHPLRWILFASPDCQPPAKLWVIQALMVLELYEKMYTDRILHERGHVHHATAIQLMRRSSVFQGSTEDHRDYYTDDKKDSPTSVYHQRIEVESFKRVAYLAFCLDVLHSVTFGHTPSISAHEIRLTLLDEAIWEGTNGDGASSVKPQSPMVFLTALKRMLNKQHVDAQPFGRHVLLFGLMSVAIQMQQRDLQASSIGWKSRKPWKEILARSYDFWAHEWGIPNTAGPLPHLHPRRDLNLGISIGDFPKEFLQSFGVTVQQQQGALLSALSLSALHFYHLGSIVLHISPHDFQIFAGVPRMLTVKMRQAQYDATNARMHEWARTEPGSLAVWHAIRILRDVYLDGTTQLTYKGHIDPVIQRPHSVTMAALALWAFVFVNAGPEDHAMANYKDPAVRLTADRNKITEWGSEILTWSEERPINSYTPKEEGYAYLIRLAGLSPVEIRTAPNLQNIIGLLQVIWKSIEKVRWEILQELSRLLQHCMERSRGKDAQRCDYMVVWRSR